MELFRKETKIDFVGKRWIFILFSLALVAASVYQWFAVGEAKWGVDFAGGMELVVEFPSETSLASIRDGLATAGFSDATVQNFEGETKRVSIKLKADKSGEVAAKVRELLKTVQPAGFTIVKEDYVGPIIGAQIRKDGLIAFALSLVGVLLYLWFRFDISYSTGAIIALFHDSIITVGVYLLAGRELNAASLAAILTLIGYSVNDTIIVFDRIRENLIKAAKTGTAGKSQKNAALDLKGIINLSINQTLSRTLLTSMSVIFVSVVFWLYGGGAISDMGLLLAVGVIKGTYSSIFIASPIVYEWERRL